MDERHGPALPPTDRSRTASRTIRSSNYDLSNTCNLTCEGCYYFVSGQKTLNRRPSFEAYDAFFAQEAARGVNYPFMTGGEPSLNLAALRAAAKHWTSGIVFTNGTRPIPRDIPFRIAISLWGGREKNDLVRGDTSYDRALDTAEGDPRAMVSLTINRGNIDDVPAVVRDCEARGVKVTFSDFSMTTEYMRLLAAEDAGTTPYFRMSTGDDNLSLRLDDRARIADVIDGLMDRHPGSIIYSRAFNDWVHRSPELHAIDPATGLATDCGTLRARWHRGYGFDLQPLKGKPCCLPEFDCRDCRVGAAHMFTLVMRLAREGRHSEDARRRLADVRDMMMRFHFWDWDLAPEAAAGFKRQRPPAAVGA